jgi:hypothetical protein
MTTVLDRLGGLDLSGVVNGRSSITAAMSVPDLARVAEQGIGPVALGSLGSDLQALNGLLSGDPAALLQPLGGLIEEVTGHLHLGVEPGTLLDATRTAVELVTAIVAALGGNLTPLSQALGREVPSLLGDVAGRIGGQPSGALSDLAAFGRTVVQLEAGAPADPHALVDLVIDATLPFPSASLKGLRVHIDTLRSSARSLTLPDSRILGLQQAIASVTTAAGGSDTGALLRSLDMLEQVRVATVAQLGRDAQSLSSGIDALQLPALAGELESLTAPLHTAESGVLDVLATLRAQVVAVDQLVADVDFHAAAQAIEALVGGVEAQIVSTIEPALEEVVGTARRRLSGFLDQLGLRKGRDEVLGAVHDVAKAIAEHDPTQPLHEMYGALDSVRTALDPATLHDTVQNALSSVVTAAENALQGVIDALAGIKTAIQAVAHDAEPIVTDATTAIEAFAGVVREVETGLESLDFAKLGDSVSQSLHDIRQTVQTVTSAVSLPDALKPEIQALADQIRSIDLQAAIEAPVAQALGALRFPDAVTQSLDAVVDKIRHIVPSELIASIEQDVNGVLDQLTHLHPDVALGALDDVVHGLANQIGSFKLADHVTVLEPAFTALRSALAEIDPARLFRPIIAAFDALMAALSIPHATAVGQSLGAGIGSAVDAGVRAVMAPISSLPGVTGAAGLPAAPAAAGSSAGSAPSGGSGTAGGAGTPGGSGTSGGGASGGGTGTGGGGAEAHSIRPGDAIRLLGHLPAMLRDALRSLDAAGADEFLHAIDSVTTALAADLRLVAVEVGDIENRVTAVLQQMVHSMAVPVANAQLAVVEHVRVQGAAGPVTFDLDAKLLAIGRAGPAGLVAELGATTGPAVAGVRTGVGQLGGSTASALERAASALERCRLAGVTSDLDAFLAAIDPEPVAAAVDALVSTAIRRGPDLVSAFGDTLAHIMEQFRALIERYQPAAIAMRFLPLLQIIDDEISLLDPRALAAEVEDVYNIIVGTVAAYDPAAIAATVDAEIAAVVTELHGFSASSLIPDTSFLQPLVDKIQGASPLPALHDAATNLDALGARLADVDLDRLVADVNGLGPKVSEGVDRAVEAIKREILALLDALQFGAANASASVSVSGSVGGGGT